MQTMGRKGRRGERNSGTSAGPALLPVVVAIAAAACISGACAKGTSIGEEAGAGGAPDQDAQPLEDSSWEASPESATEGGAGADATAGGGGAAGAMDGGTDAAGAAGAQDAGGAAGANGGSAGTAGGGAAGSSGNGGAAGSGGSGGVAGAGGTGGTAGSGGAGGCELQAWHFNSCPDGWTTAGANNDWACTAAWANGPSGDHTGAGSAWYTGMLLASSCANSTLSSPSIDLSPYAGQALRLQFWHWYKFNICDTSNMLCQALCMIDPSTYSGGVVEVWDGAKWVKVSAQGGYTGQKIECYSMDGDGGQTCSACDLDGTKGFDGSSNGAWVKVEIDISSFAIQGFQARFHFASYEHEPACHMPQRGWFIDDVAVVKLGPC